MSKGAVIFMLILAGILYLLMEHPLVFWFVALPLGIWFIVGLIKWLKRFK